MAKEKKRKKGSSKKRRAKGSVGRRLAVAVAECLVMVLLTGLLEFQLFGRRDLPQVYTSTVPSPGSGTLVMPSTSIFTGGDGTPCVYMVEKTSGRLGLPQYVVKAVSVQTEPYDEERVIVWGIERYDVPYVMWTEASLQDGMEVAVAS